MTGIRRPPARLDEPGPMVPFAASVAVTLVVAAVTHLAFPDVGRWAWIAIVAPVAIHLVDLVRSRGDDDHRPVASTGDLRRADLGRADLTGRNLRHRDLTGARLVDADLGGADLSRSDLAGARLHRADLTGASLAGAGAEGAAFYRARLVGADLDRVEAVDASFEEADLRQALLRAADLRRADFSGADVRGADFSRARMDPRALDDAITDDTTVLPDGRRGRIVDVAGLGWRSALAGSTGLVAWQVLRPVLIGLLGTATIAGAETGGTLADDVPASVEVALRTEGVERVDGPGGGQSAVLDDLGVADRDEVVVEVPEDEVEAASGDTGVRTAEDADRSELLAADRNRASGGPGTDAGDGPPPDTDDRRPRATVVDEPTRGSTDDGAPDGDTPDSGARDTTSRSAPAPDGDGTDPAAGAVESGGPEVLGLTVTRGIEVRLGSRGGRAAVTFSSPFGTTALTIDGDDEFGFDGAPPGTVRVELAPEEPFGVASCSVAAAGAVDAREGGAGEPVVCEVTVPAGEGTEGATG